MADVFSMAHVCILADGKGLFRLKRAGVSSGSDAGKKSFHIVFEKIETAEAVACLVFLRHALKSWKCASADGEETFKVSGAALSDAISKVRAYLDDFIAAKREAEALGTTESNSRVEAPTRADLTIYSRLIEIREEQDRLAIQRGYCESKLKLRIGDGAALKGVATWKGQNRQKIDLDAFKVAEPDRYEEVWQRYRSESYIRYFRLERRA